MHPMLERVRNYFQVHRELRSLRRKLGTLRSENERQRLVIAHQDARLDRIALLDALIHDEVFMSLLTEDVRRDLAVEYLKAAGIVEGT